MRVDRKKILTIATCEQAQVGQKGWFGTVTGKKKPDEWYREFMDFFDSLSEKEEIHIIDCHI